MNLLERIHALFYADLGDIEINPVRVNLVPIFRRKLFLSNKDYMIDNKPQKEGEKELIKIAETANRETHWTYFKDTGYWVHFASKSKKEHDKEKGNVEMGYHTTFMELSFAEEIGLGNKAVECHIHPDYFIDFYLECHPEHNILNITRNCYKTILLPYPSDQDLLNSLNLNDREHEIATSLGITTYRLHDKKLIAEEGTVQDLVRDCYKKTAETFNPSIDEIAKIPAHELITKEVIESVNNKLKGYATLYFHPRANFK